MPGGRESKQKRRKNTNHFLPRLKHQLLIQLQQIEPILRLARLRIDLGQELADHLHHLRQHVLVRAVVRGVLEHGFEQEGVPRETGGGLGQVGVELEFAGFGEALGDLLFDVSPS